VDKAMLDRQVRRYQNSLHEIHIIIEKYDALEQRGRLQEMVDQVKVEVEAVNLEASST
jgi:hypothetical protein